MRQYCQKMTITIDVADGAGRATVNIPSGPSGWNEWNRESIAYWVNKIREAIASARIAADEDLSKQDRWGASIRPVAHSDMTDEERRIVDRIDDE